jgi:branched-chain amino acid aminotransferase
MAVEERSIDRTELYKASEAFLCGTSARITPVLSIDKRPVGDGTVGAITAKLMKDYAAIQDGSAPEFAQWRTAI